MSFDDGFILGLSLGGGGGGSADDKWIRPSDWPELGTPADNQIIMLITTQWNTSPYESFRAYADKSGGQRFESSLAITVDWGDGTVENLETEIGTKFLDFGHYFYTSHENTAPTWNDGPILNNGAHVFVIKLTLPDGVYIVYGEKCEPLDVHIGKNIKFYRCLIDCELLSHIKFFGWQPSEDNYGIGFAQNHCLQSVEATEPFTAIPDRFFTGCMLLQEIDLSKCVTIGKESFYSNYNLKKITAPLLETIGDSAFGYCHNLKTVESPKLLSVVSHAFTYCYSLLDISHADGWTYDSMSFINCFNYYDNPTKSHPNYA